jgi:hypothetical protein
MFVVITILTLFSFSAHATSFATGVSCPDTAVVKIIDVQSDAVDSYKSKVIFEIVEMKKGQISFSSFSILKFGPFAPKISEELELSFNKNKLCYWKES